ncbi:NAD-dependent epimerase/dehydratase family protein [Kitasatospora sp. MAP5-34]|uniref:NAD-dependent epimerase/dehydratase family protein n=1 Tax=Kitasatospora sp. MAP5-34 TaxID=3035102 RepID=UPI002476A2F0|nr:NAD-dependent epimerase/dehydratase family protein [Kitasatospora sp. MAP5-34]MDH6580539.1 UDP-glucose 4-epimerase [Kitasatospora sp. MAP5-34]
MVRYLVTGGTGFLGAATVRRLLADGAEVRVLDNGFRAGPRRLDGLRGDIDLVTADVRDAEAVSAAARGVDHVLHLAYVNGTELFYRYPRLVLDVGVRGMLNVLDACLARGVGRLTLVSSSEVYQTPPVIPTPEDVPLVVPDVLNPRYSYGGGKLISELLAVNYGRTEFEQVMICRPHNVYGPDMGREHVLPQLVLRALDLVDSHPTGPLPLPVRGSGAQTRAFTHVEDFAEGLLTALRHGEHQGIYHVGNPEETSIAALVRHIGACLDREIDLVPSTAPEGETPRRCPDISRLRSLGFQPTIPLRDGLPPVVDWYQANRDDRDRRAS